MVNLATWIHGTVTSRIDCCSALHIELNSMWVQNAMTWLLSGSRWHTYIIPTLQVLHWLPVSYIEALAEKSNSMIPSIKSRPWIHTTFSTMTVLFAAIWHYWYFTPNIPTKAEIGEKGTALVFSTLLSTAHLCLCWIDQIQKSQH